MNEHTLKLDSKFEALILSNDLLDCLVEIHNKVFSGSIRRIFKPIAFDTLAFQLRRYIEALNDLRADYPHLDEISLPGLSWVLVDQTFLEFCEKVIQTYSLLALICDRLHKKSLGEPYTMAEYNKDVNTYQAMVLEHKAIGQLLTSQVKE